MNNSNILSAKLKFLYIFVCAAIACFFPFLTFYFQQKGFSYTQIGIALAFYSIAGVIAQPVWGFITDKYLNKKTSLMTAMLLSSLTIYIFIIAEGFYFIIISMILVLCFQSSVMPLSDAYTYEIIEQHKEIQYGKIRLMGSLGYGVTTLCIGQAVKVIGINSAFILFSVVMFLGALIVISIKFKGKSIHEKIDTSDIADIIKNNKFSIFLIMVIIVNISFGCNNSYITILIQNTGGDVSKLGLLWFVMAISEIPILFLGNKLLKKFSDLNLFILAIIFFALRFFLDSISYSYIFVIAIQVIHSLTYPLFLIASLNYLNRTVHQKMKTTAMTMYFASCGIGTFLGNIAGGMLLEHITIFTLFKLISFICVICLALGVRLKNINMYEFNNNVEGF
ncbi:MFS transporter [Clostridium sp. SYSU_GA19001]|uniref:MFS transporter n=1 Tax=Clostridium caldaquaticum TaxID=2940653 RepID=UPI0020777DF9|nr:MFS transporter [Clostridium caldaquaticum]MCM8709924.1 MFS transporter [Clostridium caldaquaticum]